MLGAIFISLGSLFQYSRTLSFKQFLLINNNKQYLLQISFTLDSNMLFIGVVKLGDLYMQAIQNCPILLSSSIANESGVHSEKSFYYRAPS